MTQPTQPTQGVQQVGIPGDLRAQIDAYIQAQVAAEREAMRREMGIIEPIPPTPAEQAATLLELAYKAERSEKSTPSSSGRTHELQLALLTLLIDKAFAEPEPEPVPEPVPVERVIDAAPSIPAAVAAPAAPTSQE